MTQGKWLWRRKLQAIAAAALAAVTLSDVYANPSGGKISSGSGTIIEDSKVMTIYQHTDKLGINWDSFNIGANETVNFLQPGFGAVALNRVTGPNPSAIFGQLNAKGQVFLVNSNGVLFAPTAKVSVGALAASSLSITDSDFLAGHYNFSDNNSGIVINQGMIIAKNSGYVALLGPQAKNEGIIVAKQGTVALGAGSAITMDMNGDNLVRLAVSQRAVKALAENKYLIEADGGQVIMTARTADQLAGTAVSNSGIIKARRISNVGGSIILDGDGGQAVNSGTLDASGKDKGQTGGTVKLLGDKVGIISGGTIDASGDQGGGTALIGGNYQGQGKETNARQTIIEKNTIINADAITAGSGGKVIVWANDTTDFSGNISARGGKESGDGGQAEVSGKKKLSYQGFTDLGAPKGKAGNLLLDPTDFIIDTSNAGIIESQLMGANVTILSSQGPIGTNGDIFVNNALNWESGNSLTLSAYHDVKVSAPIIGGSGASVMLKSDNTGSGIGTVSFSGAGHVNLSGGALNIYYNPASYGAPTNYAGSVSGGAVTAYMLVNKLADLSNISNNPAWWSSNYALGRDIDAAGTKTDALYNNGGLGFKPIGSNGTLFSGIFDGSGHIIDNLYIHRAEDNVGLFGYSQGKIRDLQVTNANIEGQRSVGILVGYNTGSVNNAVSTGTIRNTNFNIGGLVGDNAGGSITNSFSSANVIGNAGVGGLVGTNSTSAGSISNSYSAGIINGDHNVGGLVGLNFGSITGSSNIGSVSGNATGYNIGGLSGYNEGKIHASYNKGMVLGFNYVGGLVGYNRGNSIISSYNTAAISGRDYVGGLLGYNGNSTIISGYNIGSVGGHSFIGGLVGSNYQGLITNSYNTGYVTANASGSNDIYAGGVSGNNNGGSISGSYNTGTVNASSINYVGGVTGGQNWSGTISTSYNMGRVFGNNNVGGVAGANLNSSKIANSYNTGIVTGNKDIGGILGVEWNSVSNTTCYNTGAVFGNTNVYGLGPSGMFTDSYWDTETSGWALSAGGTGKSTVEMMAAGTYMGWDSSIWGIIPGTSYPYLKSQFSIPPQIISGKVSVTGAGKTIEAVVSGTKLAETLTGADGFYYFAVPAGSVPDNSALLTYITGESIKSNALYVSAGTHITNLDLTGGVLSLGSGGPNVTGAALKNGINSMAAGVGEILYSSTGSDITVNSPIKLNADAKLDTSGHITLGDVAADTHILSIAAKDITINGNISSTASGDAVVFVAGHSLFAGGTITNSGGGRWLVFTPDASSWTGADLAGNYAFTQYGTTYNSGLAIKGSGNGLIYTSQLTFKQSLVGGVNKTYDGTTSVNNLSIANYQIESIPGFTAQINSATAVGAYADKNVGSSKLVTAAPASLSVTDSNHKLVYGFTSTMAGGNIGKINAKTVTAVENGIITKQYDGTTAASLGSHYTLSGVISGEESLVGLAATGGVYNSKDVGSANKVTFTDISLIGTGVHNYILNTDINTFNMQNDGIKGAILPAASPTPVGNELPNNTPATIDNKAVNLSTDNSFPGRLLQYGRIQSTDSSQALTTNIINKGIAMDSLRLPQGLFTTYTHQGVEVSVLSVTINQLAKTEALTDVKTIDNAENRMTINKDLAGALSVAFLGLPIPNKGCGSVEYDGTHFLVSLAKVADRKSAEKLVAKNSFSIIYNNGQIDTYQVARRGSNLTVMRASNNDNNIARLTPDITKLILALSIKAAVEAMQIDPSEIRQVIWNI